MGFEMIFPPASSQYDARDGSLARRGIACWSCQLSLDVSNRKLRPRQDPRPVPFDSPRVPIKPARFPRRKPRLRPRARLVRTGTVPPSRRRLRRPNSVIENHVARRARTRGRGQRWGPNPPPPSPSPPPSPPVK
ncbi:cold shock domain protein 1 [Prunus dulcis]|uniref:Cold shock domain protein 1 n=1 Tax=Prunus dulcis TaxID=3755 RepID=A0A4Y1R6S2_PRUDU|nr:cold shock domain protein 1 [Prunus dulcis]